MQGRARALEGWPSSLAEKMTSEKGLEGERLHRLHGGLSRPRAGTCLAMRDNSEM